MALLELGPVAFGGTPAIIAFLQSKYVLARQKQCTACPEPTGDLLCVSGTCSCVCFGKLRAGKGRRRGGS